MKYPKEIELHNSLRLPGAGKGSLMPNVYTAENTPHWDVLCKEAEDGCPTVTVITYEKEDAKEPAAKTSKTEAATATTTKKAAKKAAPKRPPGTRRR
jgi:hypothetical protein